MKTKNIFQHLIILCLYSVSVHTFSQDKNKQFTESLMQDSCTFETTGRNLFCILEPGYQLVLEAAEGDDTSRLVITVLNETKKIGNVETRIVEESESENGEIREISKNFFAFCKQDSSIYYFGEEVDIYKKGKVVSHEGSWIAEESNKPGIIMPGKIVIGQKYYMEYAPGIAIDLAENVSVTEIKQTPAGKFENCLKTEETSGLNPKEKEYKFYAPGIGLIKDENLLLTNYGFVK